MLRGYDIDGVLTAGIQPEGVYVVISGRTFAEYDDRCKLIAQQVPLFIRGTGAYGDRKAAGEFKAAMVRLLGVDEFYEDDPVQAACIERGAPDCRVRFVTAGVTA